MAKCKTCEQDIVGFDQEGYCEDCLCSECGQGLDHDYEVAAQICGYCSMEEEEEE
jgi:hypothetical protein